MCVGVFLALTFIIVVPPRLPHVRGGVSYYGLYSHSTALSSPCAWGCFCIWIKYQEQHRVFPMCVGVFLNVLYIFSLDTVFPMCVGVFLKCRKRKEILGRLPHVRGGVSTGMYADLTAATSSPCAWGCFHYWPALAHIGEVFPMCVGVFPGTLERDLRIMSLPHVRGGVSCLTLSVPVRQMSSPCAWGCFHRTCVQPYQLEVFPMCVGVFLCA